MSKLLAGFLSLVLFHASAYAADRIRIGIPNIGAQFMTFPLAQKKGFLNEEGLEVEHIRIFGPVAMAALVNGDLDYWGAIGFSVRSAMQECPSEQWLDFCRDILLLWWLVRISNRCRT